jgi:hypothetical protein
MAAFQDADAATSFRDESPAVKGEIDGPGGVESFDHYVDGQIRSRRGDLSWSRGAREEQGNGK